MKKIYTQSAEEVLQNLFVGTESWRTSEAQSRFEKHSPSKLKEAEKPPAPGLPGDSHCGNREIHSAQARKVIPKKTPPVMSRVAKDSYVL